MKKEIFILVFAIIFGVVGFNSMSFQTLAAMPDNMCSNLAETKDMVVQKNTKYEYLLSSYLFVDPCTGEYYSDNPNSPYYNPTDIYRSYDDGISAHYERYYIPESGSIFGNITEHGWRGGQKWSYLMCSGGTAKITHYSFGWWYSNSNTICSSI